MSIVAKWENSLAISILKNIADKINLKEETTILIDVTENNIVITPEKPKYTLEEMLAGASSENFEEEYNWGETITLPRSRPITTEN